MFLSHEPENNTCPSCKVHKSFFNWEVDWSQNSTKRGAIWVVIFFLGLISIFTGFGDLSKLMLLGAGVAGGLGVALKD